MDKAALEKFEVEMLVVLDCHGHDRNCNAAERAETEKDKVQLREVFAIAIAAGEIEAEAAESQLAAASIAALEAKLAEARKDAERYRWLREHFEFANDSMEEIWFNSHIKHYEHGVSEELDAAIDAAIQRGGK